MTQPLISFVLTTHNEATGIRATIEALDGQRDLPGVAEIVMVDDRSTDDTVAEAEAALSPILRILKAAPDPASRLTTRQQALDMAFRAARGDIVLTVDADSDIPPRWAARMTAPILEGECDAVSGPIGFAPLSGALARWQSLDAGQYFLISRLTAAMGWAGGVLFGNFAFRRGWYEKVGGFDKIGFALTEDLSFGYALYAGGADMGFAGRGTRIDVRPVPSIPALVARTMRISSGPASPLAAMLTGWTLSLLVLMILTLFIPALWPLLAMRYIAGVLLVAYAVRDRRDPKLFGMAFLYEPLVYVLAAVVLWRVARGARVGWGGQSYDR